MLGSGPFMGGLLLQVRIAQVTSTTDHLFLAFFGDANDVVITIKKTQITVLLISYVSLLVGKFANKIQESSILKKIIRKTE